MVLGGLAVGRWDQRRVADVLLDARISAVNLVVACRGSPRRRARPRARRLPCTCLGCFHLGFFFGHTLKYIVSFSFSPADGGLADSGLRGDTRLTVFLACGPG